MRPLTLDDLIPLEEYAARRREYFESLTRYLDRYRRIRIGPSVMLVFENRQTLWFRLHELLRVARLADPVFVQRELDTYNRLLPGRDQLQAALLLEASDPGCDLGFWRGLDGNHLQFCFGVKNYSAQLVTCRPEDRCLGTAHWVRFVLDAAGRRLLADWHRPASFRIVHADYRHDSAALSEDVRQSLLEDLELSDRDSA
ncbi:MAG: DUF3501 family protein [Gemmataceae bacterium]